MKNAVKLIVDFSVSLLLAGSAWAESPPSTTIEVAGTAFPAASVGEGAAVLFVHGSFADHRLWDGLAADVAMGHHFIAYTQRGFGTSEWPAHGTFSRDSHTADLVAILKARGEPNSSRRLVLLRSDRPSRGGGGAGFGQQRRRLRADDSRDPVW